MSVTYDTQFPTSHILHGFPYQDDRRIVFVMIVAK